MVYGTYLSKAIVGPSETLPKYVFTDQNNFYCLQREDLMKADFGPFSNAKTKCYKQFELEK